MEDVAHLSNTIMLSVVVQVYRFHGKSKKLKKKKKALNHHRQESNKKVCAAKFTEA